MPSVHGTNSYPFKAIIGQGWKWHHYFPRSKLLTIHSFPHELWLLVSEKSFRHCLTTGDQLIHWTKYLFLPNVEPLKKHTRDRPAELELLRQANIFVKDILKGINACVAEKEHKQRLDDITNKIDPRASLMHQNRKFKKSDLISSDK